jgi:proton-dependent oligopeptide transporter, POT family
MAQALTASANRFPPQIKYIVGNEACERFSFYGMRSILVVFMTGHLLMAPADAKASFHLFVSACYLLPLLGGWISDRFLGKYKTIMLLSMAYCLGHATLAVFETRTGLFAGLALIALGSGGIKPCVSAHVGDQFNDANKHLMKRVFDLFYWSINFGAFFSTLLIPVLLTQVGPSIAFGLPGILMFIATIIFWMGRKQYVHVPPTGRTGEPGFIKITYAAIQNRAKRKQGQSFLDAALGKYTREQVEGAKAVIDIIKVFATISVFWALFDQNGSSWVLQAQQMDRTVLGFALEASQIQALNPILVMILIPIFSFGIYPAVEKLGIKVTPLRKIAAGMVFTALSFVIVGLAQNMIDAGMKVSIGWQALAFIVLTCGEVMVSITGLEFAYTQAPRAMKSTIMSFWLLTVFAGNLLTAYVEKINVFSGATQFYVFAGMMAAVSLIFALTASRYKVRNFIESGAAAPLGAAPASAS